MNADTGTLLLLPRRSAPGFRVRYTLPNLAPLLLGRPIAEAEALTGRLHAVCGSAHRVALARAVVDATNAVMTRARCVTWMLLLVIEQAEVMARRVALDLPGAGGESAKPEEARPVLAAARVARHALGVASVRGPLAPNVAALPGAMAELSDAFDRLIGAHRGRPVPVIDDDGAGLQSLVDEAWSMPHITADALAAAVTEAADVAAEPALPPVDRGSGVGSADTVRGRLTTKVGIMCGDVVTIEWTTPTDRLFTEGGFGALLLEQWAGSARDLAVLMAALDPCVPWRTSAAQVHA